MRARILQFGHAAVPKSWRRQWIIQRIVATPPWACFVEIRAVYARAAELTERTGVLHVVDHQVPLNHPRVCGLHIAANLRAIPERHNAAKSNYWCPEQLELFEGPEQLRLL
jgi:hypothetical protein